MSHVAAIACHKMWRLPFFASIRGNHQLRKQIIAAGNSTASRVAKQTRRWNHSCPLQPVFAILALLLHNYVVESHLVAGKPHDFD